MAERGHTIPGAILLVSLLLIAAPFQRCLAEDPLPKGVPARRSTQLSDGLGVNLPLPRQPRLSWNEKWWTRVFDSGVKWVRIGQYENSSEKTGWDWVEREPGVYRVLPEVDEAIRSLRDNGVSIEMQLCYGNPLYHGDPASRPKHIDPAPPGIGPGDPNPVFNGLDTVEEIEGFLNYTRFMVNRYKEQVQGWEFWNEENIGFWQPDDESREGLAAKVRAYGKALCRFADVVHEISPKSKVIFGGTSSSDPLFVLSAIQGCPEKIDVMAYHAYPGYGGNHPPEAADALVGASAFREAVLRAPGIQKSIEFWDNEWNVIPAWRNSNESVQARYVPRYFLQTKAQHVNGFIWEFVPGTDGNEDDEYGLIHGANSAASAFQPRPSYRAFQVTAALFGQTERDLRCDVLQDRSPEIPQQYSHGELKEYCFRDRTSGAPIYAVWLAIYSDPADNFKPVSVDVPIPDPAIQNPILVDVRTGKISPATWRDKHARTISVGVTDSVTAIADASYLNWRKTPETPWGLSAKESRGRVQLTWEEDGEHSGFELQRSVDWGAWQKIGALTSGDLSYSEPAPTGSHISYRVRALGTAEASPWSNPAWIESKQ
jgi:hypothetical protein